MAFVVWHRIDHPAKKTSEVSERSPLLASTKQYTKANYNTATNNGNNDHQSPPAPPCQVPRDANEMEAAQQAHANRKCHGRLFSIGFISLILIGGMTVGSYLLNQYDREWTTNTPFELVERRSWRGPEFAQPRVRNSRSENKPRSNDQPQEPGQPQLRRFRLETSSANGNSFSVQNTDMNNVFQEGIVDLTMQDNTANGKPVVPEMEVQKKRSGPATHVVIAHTEGPACSEKKHCQDIVRQMHVRSTTEMGLLDIPYNFLIGGDGHTYEGRGWHTHDALLHSLQNHTTVSIAFIGDFNKEVPPHKQLEEAKALIIESIRRRKLTPHYHLVGHRQVNENTRSPGDALMHELAGWRHWRPCSKNEC